VLISISVFFLCCHACFSTATDEHILQTLMELVHQLLSDDELMLARTMRKKVLEKYTQHRLRLQYNQQVTLLSSYQLSTKYVNILKQNSMFNNVLYVIS